MEARVKALLLMELNNSDCVVFPNNLILYTIFLLICYITIPLDSLIDEVWGDLLQPIVKRYGIVTSLYLPVFPSLCNRKL